MNLEKEAYLILVCLVNCHTDDNAFRNRRPIRKRMILLELP
jgi:hypothetical protein